MVDSLERAIAILRSGGLVGMPTETVYGLAADASNAEAVRRIFAVKGRPADHPLIVHVADASRLADFAYEVPARARLLAEAFWPGPLTLVLPRHVDVLDVVTGGRDTVAIRVPAHPVARSLLEAFGGGLAAPSANRFGRVSPTRAEHVRADLGGDVDLVLEGGDCDVGLESTIVDLTTHVPTLLRSGAIDHVALEHVLGERVERFAVGPSRAPGMLAAHYAPNARVVLVPRGTALEHAREASRLGQRAAALGVGLGPGDDVPRFDLGDDLADAGRRLYAALRGADAAGVDCLFAETPEEHGLGAAIGDRLRRAARAG